MRQRLKHWLFQRGKNCKHCCLWCEYFSICSWDTVGRKERKKMQIFYPEYMERRRPKTPRCICENEIKRQLGIISPSLYGIVAAGGKGEEEAKELAEYSRKAERYLCYKRRLSKERWKALYREYRKERRGHEKL